MPLEPGYPTIILHPADPPSTRHELSINLSNMTRTKKGAQAKRHAKALVKKQDSRIPGLSTDIVLTAPQKDERNQLWQKLQRELSVKLDSVRKEEAQRHGMLFQQQEEQHRLQQQQVCRLVAPSGWCVHVCGCSYHRLLDICTAVATGG